MSSLNLTTSARYTGVAIALHWILAILVLSLIPIGWWMGDAIREPATQAQALKIYPVHKAVGMTVLALTVLRIVWRLTHKAPPLPARMAGWEKAVARGTHGLFYLLLIAMPLSGWIYASAGYSEAFKAFVTVPISWFGVFTIPDFPGVATQPNEARKAIGLAAINVHSKLAWAMLILAALHAGAALKHQFVDRDDVLARMLPFLKRSTHAA